ncbi:MAG: hypothetical protein KIT31_29885 [Deltaproteobacteria bacterium]|nr:hypothetical protein [Deltaproteobacteria bacterium]
MVEISVTEPGVPTWRRSFVSGRLVIGSGPNHQLELTNGVEPKHAVLFQGGRNNLVVAPAGGLVRVGGKKVWTDREVGPRRRARRGLAHSTPSSRQALRRRVGNQRARATASWAATAASWSARARLARMEAPAVTSARRARR